MGCVAALTVGAWEQNAKADYTDTETVKLHWEDIGIKDSFPNIFDDSFRFSDWLWSAAFSPNFKQEKGALYRIRKAAEDDSYHTFHTADELQALQIDASLKKICKALGSRRFLVESLGEVTVNTVCDRSMQPNRETTVTFDPYYDGETFFDAYGNARLDMYVVQTSNAGDTPLHCSFRLTFKKEGENVSLTRYSVIYVVGTLGVGFRFLPKPQALLSQNLFLTLKQAGLRMNDIYRNLFDKKSREEVEFEKHSAVYIDDGKMHQFGINGFFKDNNDDDDDERRFDMDVDAWDLSREIFSSKAFLSGIFGEEMWQMLEKYTRCYREDYDFNVNYTLKPLKNDKGNAPDQFEVYLRISDMIDYTKESEFYPIDTKSEHFFFIGFRFIFDFRKNEIRDVKFCDKLCLNGELITRGETEETTWDLTTWDL